MSFINKINENILLRIKFEKLDAQVIFESYMAKWASTLSRLIITSLCMIECMFGYGVNRRLPFEIVSFVNYSPDVNKTSITPLKLHNVNQFTSSVKFFC